MKQKVSNNTSNKEKDENKMKENGKINVKAVQNKLDEDVVIMLCNSSNNLNLPIIDLKFSDSCFAALLDTGANVSLIQPSALEKIKEQNKEAKSRHGVSLVPVHLTTLEEDLKQQLVCHDSPKYVLSDSDMEIELGIPFTSNRDPRDSPQQSQLDEVVHYHPLE
ncbi:hypothetical protein AVEN_86618-1 [Araneus ventricosus]|uniref:Uncharacterized protein n=1 Tax=Araneus ventricosus TaxID=182803 RepID=A0A4Y2S8J7_ARAVE|nr:hypothetical protein AVEN_86618-1 [Araneus ventricosus]